MIDDRCPLAILKELANMPRRSNRISGNPNAEMILLELEKATVAHVRMVSRWEKFPAGTNSWGPIMGEAGKHGEKDSDPYPLLRMVDDMNWFRLNGNIPDHPKYNATITVVMAKADTVLPTSWDDFDLETGYIKPGKGVSKVVGFNDHMTADHHKVIFDALRTWIAYIEDAVAEAQIEFTLKVIESDDPVHCDFR